MVTKESSSASDRWVVSVRYRFFWITDDYSQFTVWYCQSGLKAALKNNSLPVWGVFVDCLHCLHFHNMTCFCINAKCHQHPFFLEHDFLSLPQWCIPSSCWLSLLKQKNNGASRQVFPQYQGNLGLAHLAIKGLPCDQRFNLIHGFMQHWSKQSSITRISCVLTLQWNHAFNINDCHFINNCFQQ